MAQTLILTKRTQEDLDDAYQWYQDLNQGLGQESIRCVDAKLSEISRNPLHYQIVFNKRVHRALTNRFPFSIYYVNEEDIITVFAILHQRRNPESWKTRTE